MIPIVIPSHKRAQIITTHRHVADCIICVPESQKDEYKEACPDNEILTHPDSIKGLSPKRQWIYEKFGDVFFLDDDVTDVLRLYLPPNHKKPPIKPEQVRDWIYDLAGISRQMGFKMFGFNRTPHPKNYEGQWPFKFNIYIPGGCFGLLKDPNLYFPDWPDFVGEDYWINALNAHFNRMNFIDMRLAFAFGNTEAGIGGCADYRTDESRKRTLLFLRKSFGSAIKRKGDNDIRKPKSLWEKRLDIPF